MKKLASAYMSTLYDEQVEQMWASLEDEQGFYARNEARSSGGRLFN